MKYARKKSKKNIVIPIVIVLIIILAGVITFFIIKKPKTPFNSIIEEIMPPSVSGTENTQKDEAINDLTGLGMNKEYKDYRPIAVMINNLDGAQPLLGVCDADIMYECPVEGGITRILAVFKNPRGIEKIGSVRSARPYFINIAQGLDAIYMHIGGSSQATEMLKSKNIDSFSLGAYADMMWRDPKRRANLGYEHSALTSGDRLVEGVNNSGVRSKLKSDYKFKQSFSKKDSQVQSGGDALKVKVKFSNYKSTSFEYNTDDETYMISQFNEPQMDDNAKKQNSKQNIILIKTDVTTIDSSNDLKAVAIIGSGNGQYISNGKIINIKWSKSSATEPIKYTTLDGKELIMVPGQSYVCVLPLDADVNVN